MKSYSQYLLNSMNSKVIKDKNELNRVLNERKPCHVVTCNLNTIFHARRFKEFEGWFQEADFITCDGWPIVDFFKTIHRSVEKVSGSQLVRDLVESPDYRNFKIGLVGGSDLASQRFKKLLTENGSTLVFNIHSPLQEWDPTKIGELLLINDIDLLLISAPLLSAEEFIYSLKRELMGKFPTIINIGAGLAMLAESEDVNDKLKKIRLEWFGRMLKNPSHLTRRYLFQNLPIYVLDLMPVTIKNRIVANCRAGKN